MKSKRKKSSSPRSLFRGRAARSKMARQERRCPIVGVGASAGGLEAFTELLKHLPTDTGMGFVLVQHLDPEHNSLLPSLLSNATTMPVLQVTNGMQILPNQVYVIPPNAGMVITDGT